MLPNKLFKPSKMALQGWKLWIARDKFQNKKDCLKSSNCQLVEISGIGLKSWNSTLLNFYQSGSALFFKKI